MEMNKENDFIIDSGDLGLPLQETQEKEPMMGQGQSSPEELGRADTGGESDSIETGSEIFLESEINTSHEKRQVETSVQLQNELPDDKTAQCQDLSSRINAISDTLNELITKFDEKIFVDENKNQLFDKMYSELSAYKNDIYAKLLKPFILETIGLLDDTNRFVEKIDTLEPEQVVKYVRGLSGDLVNILEINGVELYEDETDVFNPRTQRAVKTIPTPDEGLDNKIESRIRKGYRWNGVTLKPEMVQIYKYKI